MVEYSKELSYIKTERYDGIVKFVKNIVRIMKGFNPYSINYHFNFEHDNIKCVATSLDEFIDDNHVRQIPIPLLKNSSVQDKINSLALLANQKRYEAYKLEKQALEIMDKDVIYAK